VHLSLKKRSIIALCIVALSYSILTVVVRLMNAGFGPFTQVYLRIGLGCLLTVVVFYKKIHFTKISKISVRDWVFLLLMGTLGYGLAVDFVTLGTLLTKLLDVAIIASTTPFFVFLFYILFLRKSFRKYLLFFLIMAFYGVCVLATKGLIPVFNEFGIGDFYVLLFAVGLGIYILGRKKLSSYLNNYEIAFLVMFIAFVSSLIVAILFREPLSLTGFSNPYALIGLILGGGLNLIATTLETFAFKHINAVAGSQILLLENVFTPFFGYIFYREIILPIEFFGALLVVSGVWLYIKNADD
jgi:drug/metabolite transporter (DMT)-like permease